jgi:hypothetical protein
MANLKSRRLHLSKIVVREAFELAADHVNKASRCYRVLRRYQRAGSWTWQVVAREKSYREALGFYTSKEADLAADEALAFFDPDAQLIRLGTKV